MAEALGVGLVGYGGIGRLHALCYRMLPLLYPELAHMPQLVMVATASAASAARAEHELGGTATTTDLATLLNHPDIRVIDCCAPTGEHSHVGRAALLAGKQLYCEKPLGTTPAESAELVALAAQHKLAGGVHYHFRGIPALQTARQQISAGLLGAVTGFNARYYRASNLKTDRPLSWRFNGPGSGVLVDLGAHLIDLVLHLLGPIVAVSARTRTLVPERPGPDGRPVAINSDDDVFLAVELADGGFGSLRASKVVPGAGDDLRIEAYGRNGAFSFDSRDPNSLMIAEGPGAAPGGRRLATLSRGQPLASIPGSETPTATLQWHLAMLAGFYAAIGQGATPPVSLASGAAVDQVVAAAQHSAASGGAWVPV